MRNQNDDKYKEDRVLHYMPRMHNLVSQEEINLTSEGSPSKYRTVYNQKALEKPRVVGFFAG